MGVEAVAAVAETVMATMTAAAGSVAGSAALAVVVVAAGAVEGAVAPVIIIANRTSYLPRAFSALV